MIILDTDVLSALMRPTPDEQVMAWLDGQAQTSVWITSVTGSGNPIWTANIATGQATFPADEGIRSCFD